MATNRLKSRFALTRAENRPALVTFVTAGDPDFNTSVALISKLAQSGADIIELGMPFSDPMADGPAIQLANLRALKAGMTLSKTLDMVATFREQDTQTPIVLMGYYNPIHHFGVSAFLDRANEVGVDGLIIVDLPTEEDAELCHPARVQGIDWIRLTTPTTDTPRLEKVLKNASGFVYYVSIAGITGTASAQQSDVDAALQRIREKTDLPIAVGFGIKTAEQVKATGKFADGVVVGSAIVDVIRQSVDTKQTSEHTVALVSAFVSELASGCQSRDA